MARDKTRVLFVLLDGGHNSFQVKAYITESVKMLKGSIRAKCGVPEEVDMVLSKVSSF